MIDLEKSAINVLKRQFPKSNIRGCYFHICQSWMRKGAKFSLAKKDNITNFKLLMQNFKIALHLFPDKK